eukprot:244761_1
MTALSYYNKISPQKPQHFIDFCDTYYSKNYLQDYIHFICTHKNEMNKDETKNNTCMTRHYHDIKNDQNIETPHLHVNIFDSLHFYMPYERKWLTKHLYEIYELVIFKFIVFMCVQG